MIIIIMTIVWIIIRVIRERITITMIRMIINYNNDNDNGIADNNVNNNVILLSGFVNNPGKDNILLLKQLESIIENIKE